MPTRYPLPQPFLVIATQNPVEHHGTYPLPESQLDRFLMRVRWAIPTATLNARSCAPKQAPRNWKRCEPVLTGADVLEMQQAVTQVRGG